MSYFDQTIEEKLVQADAFFGPRNDVRHLDWSKISEDERMAGLAQAERTVNLYLGVDLAVTYGDDDFPLLDQNNFRPDYAIFEHAYFMLDNIARTHTAVNGSKDIESEFYQEEERTSGLVLAPDAARYLQLNRAQIMRG